jgi:hypothetical protein
MLHRGFHREIALGRVVIHPPQLTSGPHLPLEPKREISINWQGVWRLALINLVGWLMLFALLLLIANYVQDATSFFLEQ